jgi:predicted O-methyltransferase YrrM
MKQKLAHYNNIVARRVQKFSENWAAHYWHRDPFGSAPRANRETYLALWNAERDASYPESDAYEQKTTFVIDQKWLHDLALHTQIVIKKSPLCYQHGRILYSCLRAYVAHARDKGKTSLTILETGTARGFSSLVMAKALQEENMDGRVITFDLLPHDRLMYWNCIDDHEGRKTRRQLLKPWKDLADRYLIFVESDSRIGLQKTITGNIDFAFLDGAHTYRDVMDEFSLVAARQDKGNIIVFDDYNTTLFPGLVKAVDEGCVRLNYTKEIIRARGDRAYVIAQKRD